MKGDIVIFRGGGDVATGSIQKLHRVGFRVLVLEKEKPLCIRRTISCAEAMIQGKVEIEDFIAVKVENKDEILNAWDNDYIPVIADENGEYIKEFNTLALVDAMIAKKNLGTKIDMAPITVALGPGFTAKKDVDVVIETNRGHNLARLIFEGQAEANTGNPGNMEGYTVERVLHSPAEGKIKVVRDIGSVVEEGETLAYIDEIEVKSKLKGMVRGMIGDESNVEKGMKIGDVDPRINLENTKTISDKARAIGGASLEAIMIMKRIKNL
ncbi:MAG: selenium-dependent molybdenum cofactor biosynthesis protein YqeB [Peptoniphilaceae bacterium]